MIEPRCCQWVAAVQTARRAQRIISWIKTNADSQKHSALLAIGELLEVKIGELYDNLPRMFFLGMVLMRERVGIPNFLEKLENDVRIKFSS